MTKEDEDLMRCIKMDYGMMNSDELYEDELKKYISQVVSEALINWYYSKLKE